MVETVTVAVAVAVCLGAAALAQGRTPTRARVLGTTLLGIAGAVLAWMLIGTLMTVPESGAAALGVWMIVLSAGLARWGTHRSTPGAA